MTPRIWKIVGASVGVLVVLTLVGLFVWPGWAHSQTAPAAEPTPYPPQPTLTPYPTAEPPVVTDVPSVPTAVPVSTSVPSGSMPDGWTEVEVTPPQCTAGRRLVFNHDLDGHTTDVFVTWGVVERLDDKGNVVENLGKILRLTQDPDGERLAVIGGWRKFRFSTQPTQADVDALVAWAKNELARNANFACDNVNDYAVSVQEITHAPSEAVANTEPSGWSEVALNPTGDSFVPAGDALTQEKDWDHQGHHWVTIAWFWANFSKPTGNNGCTATITTSTGKTSFWFQGGHRTWQYEGGNPTKDDIQALVRWWIEKALETEPNGAGCSRPGAYTIIWQDASLAPTSSNGRP